MWDALCFSTTTTHLAADSPSVSLLTKKNMYTVRKCVSKVEINSVISSSTPPTISKPRAYEVVKDVCVCVCYCLCNGIYIWNMCYTLYDSHVFAKHQPPTFRPWCTHFPSLVLNMSTRGRALHLHSYSIFHLQWILSLFNMMVSPQCSRSSALSLYRSPKKY